MKKASNPPPKFKKPPPPPKPPTPCGQRELPGYVGAGYLVEDEGVGVWFPVKGLARMHVDVIEACGGEPTITKVYKKSST